MTEGAIDTAPNFEPEWSLWTYELQGSATNLAPIRCSNGRGMFRADSWQLTFTTTCQATAFYYRCRLVLSGPILRREQTAGDHAHDLGGDWRRWPEWARNLVAEHRPTGWHG